MGISQPVQNLVNSSRSIQVGVARQLQSLERASAPWRADFDKNVEAFYLENQWNPVRLGINNAIDIQLIELYSMSGISENIELQAQRLLSDNNHWSDRKALTYASAHPFDSPSGDSIQLAMAINAAIGAICLALSLFDRKLNAKIDRCTLTQRLVPGLNLHIFGCSSILPLTTSEHGSALLIGRLDYEIAWSSLQQQEESGSHFLMYTEQQLAQLNHRFSLYEQAREVSADAAMGDSPTQRFFLAGQVLKKVIRKYQAQADILSSMYFEHT